jgi:hypothetical protein
MLMIDSPVTRYSPTAEIQTWVEELERWLNSPKYHQDDRRVLRRNLDRAKSWLTGTAGSSRR